MRKEIENPDEIINEHLKRVMNRENKGHEYTGSKNKFIQKS